MRILILSYFFPPYNAIGAVRTGKTAKYLAEAGHDVRVISAADQASQPTLPLEIDPSRVVYTPWMDVNAPVTLAMGGKKRTAAKGYAVSGPGRAPLQRLAGLYKTLLHFPDGMIGWLPYLNAEIDRQVADWKPDLIFASALPFTSLIGAHLASRRWGVPWVAEFRDLWTQGSYYGHTGVRRAVEERLERWVLSSAAGFSTVSEPLADVLRATHGKPTTSVLNGFDPGDYPADAEVPYDDGRVNLVYSGMLYPGRRDPGPVFEAIRLLGPLADRVRVRFYGRYMNDVPAIAAAHGVERHVEVHDQVPYREALRLQATADALLLIIWNNPAASGAFTGKFFEYMGARRPILALGPRHNVALRLVRERGAGAVADTPEEIAGHLRAWIAEKEATGRVAAPPPEALAGLSRREQSAHLAEFLVGVAAGHGAPNGNQRRTG